MMLRNPPQHRYRFQPASNRQQPISFLYGMKRRQVEQKEEKVMARKKPNNTRMKRQKEEKAGISNFPTTAEGFYCFNFIHFRFDQSATQPTAEWGRPNNAHFSEGETSNPLDPCD